MPNYYTSFCAALERLTNEEQDWLREQLKEVSVFEDGSVFSDEEVPAEYADDEPIWTGYRFFADEHEEDCWPFSYEWFKDNGRSGLALCNGEEESDGLESVGPFVSEFLKSFRPDSVWTLEWADTCSRQCIGVFGGGCLLVKADDYWSVSTGQLAKQQPDKLLEMLGMAKGATEVHDADLR